ncbi:hypothetical protein JX265_009750 [Neoarthrinium moseri]|uniref:Utp8 beta-propeller domain-containing protein n=1 Tax=Neoarthrinium moseri TaxID=1658444 RepID=A0A9P9WFN6_9PEZI|nr:hypothetical protein JX265_009750 [Neoarthrinium moseri]
MASNFHVQKPYVLTTLPRPLDPSTGRYVVGEVYGTTEGSRKRKRSEVTVGVDGEAVNIYDVSSARLVTSYPIPPQSSFTCPPTSLRRRIPGSKDVARYTYIATKDPALTLTLFKDIVESSGKTTSSTKTTSLPATSPVVYLATRLAPTPKGDALSPTGGGDLLVVRESGEILGLDSESLQQKWKTSPAILHQDLAYEAKAEFKLEACISARASEVIDGIFKGNRDALSSIASELRDNADPELLLAVSSMPSDGQRLRHLHLLGPIPHSQTLAHSSRGLIQLHVVPIVASSVSPDSKSQYRVDVRSGTLSELSNGTLTVYDLTANIPKVLSQIQVDDATSFVRLSKSSVLTSTPSLLNVYNPQFRSMQSSVTIDPDSQTETDSPKSPGCALVGYFSRLQLAIGISESSLLAIQLEAPKSRTNKRRAEGLLIDSIGRGIPETKRAATESKKRAAAFSTFSTYLPGSMLGDYLEAWTEDVQRADTLLESDSIEKFEALLAEKFGLSVRAAKLTNGVKHTEKTADQPLSLPEWEWPEDRSAYPRVDRRWIIYSISRAFQWNTDNAGDSTIPRLVCSLPFTNVVSYLADAGHLTVSNVKSALREQLSGVDNVDYVVADELITRLAELDPTLELLTCYISGTTLGSVELVTAVRTIMRSLELVQDPTQPPPKMLTSTAAEGTENGDIGMELDHLEEEVFKAESILNGNMGVRGSGLSVAFAKLGNCPATSMIKALRTTLKPEEILSLVYLLRVELVKGAWTSRYLDTTDFEEDAELDAPPDGIIKLLADLLSRCVDSIGPGGWLLNDALLAGDDSGDFIASLKLEVSAALEGLEEAVYLKGVVSEAVRYCEAAQKAEIKQRFDLAKPISLQVKELGSEALPLGLKIKGKIEKTKVVSGGEIVQRSTREKGHLRSQQVGPYSLERIAI